MAPDEPESQLTSLDDDPPVSVGVLEERIEGLDRHFTYFREVNQREHQDLKERIASLDVWVKGTALLMLLNVISVVIGIFLR